MQSCPQNGSHDNNLTENFNKLLLILEPNSDPRTQEVTQDRQQENCFCILNLKN
jgi:hypothetical protein